jgi:glycosyltransferase involved in cell wall biosynthesis
MKKIKVLEIIDKPFLGGGQRHLLSLARSLDKKRFDVMVGSADGGPFVDAVKKEGLAHTAIPIRKRIDRQTVNFLVPMLKNSGYDIIHTHGGVAGFFGRWAARKAQTPVIVHTLHGIHYLHYRNPAARIFSVWLERFFSRFTQALIFVSDADRQQGSRHKLAAENRMHTIKNGIDFEAVVSKALSQDEVSTAKKQLSLKEDSPVIGTISRLHRQKGLPFLLEAMRDVGKAFPAAKLVIVGDGPEKESLQHDVSRLSIGNRVIFLGERPDAQQLLSLFDLFVLPSLWEGLPYVLMEAAALKVPVIASLIDGVKEVISHEKTGLLVPSKNSQDLARGIIRLLEEPGYAKKLGRNLHDHCSRTLTQEIMVREIQELYSKLYDKSHNHKIP